MKLFPPSELPHAERMSSEAQRRKKSELTKYLQSELVAAKGMITADRSYEDAQLCSVL